MKKKLKIQINRWKKKKKAVNKLDSIWNMNDMSVAELKKVIKLHEDKETESHLKSEVDFIVDAA